MLTLNSWVGLTKKGEVGVDDVLLGVRRTSRTKNANPGNVPRLGLIPSVEC